jgi:hypothetical protein
MARALHHYRLLRDKSIIGTGQGGLKESDMKWMKSAVLVAVVAFLAIQGYSQRGQGMGGMKGLGNGTASCLTQIQSLPLQTVDKSEAEALTYMREEEKLAHDVYVKLYARWGTQVFGNISQSELRHMDALKSLLDRYTIADPVVSMELGAFKSDSLKTLYKDLIAKGESSLQNAWQVGATVEDLDIHDLQAAALSTDNADLKLVYGNLEKASRNHLRAYSRQLAALGITYKNQYISDVLLAEILSTANVIGSGCNRSGCNRTGSNGAGCNGSGICDGTGCNGTGAGDGCGMRRGSGGTSVGSGHGPARRPR